MRRSPFSLMRALRMSAPRLLAGGSSGGLARPGFALLLVLWSLVLISLLVTQLAVAARSESRLALNLRTAAVAEAAANGAIHEAVFHLLDTPERRWMANGTAHEIGMSGVRVVVRVENEAGKVNPNTAQLALLRALMHQAGVDTRTAATIAAAILEWRFPGDQPGPEGGKAARYRAAGRDYAPPGAPFENLDELGLVLGMTPELLARLTPNLTLHHEGEPDPRAASQTVLQALREAAGVIAEPSGPIDGTTVVITAAARGENNSRFTRRAVVRIGAGAGGARAGGAGREAGGSLYEIVIWDTPDP